MASTRCDAFFETLVSKIDEVNTALMGQMSTCGFPVYSSIDIRDAGWKICVVDVNLFPAGFNILSDNDRTRASTRMREFFSAKLMKSAPWKIVVVPEAHTNNQGYLENLSGILKILRNANCEVRLLWPGDPIPKAWKIKTPSGEELEYLPAAEALDGADAILLNHDLSGGIPKAIQGVNLPIFPSTRLGWYQRRKSTHFEIVDSLLKKISTKLPFFDPWYFSMKSSTLKGVNFDSPTDLSMIADAAQQSINALQAEYKERGVPEKPYLFIKNDAGTYGMGVISIQDASEIEHASSALRKKMRKGKESVPISQVIMQEGIPTALHYTENRDGKNIHVAAEPALYMVNGNPVGGFLRIHEGLGANARFENLNQPGSKLEPIDYKDPQTTRPFPLLRNLSPAQQCEVKQTYGFLARLHAVAAGLEDCPK